MEAVYVTPLRITSMAVKLLQHNPHNLQFLTVGASHKTVVCTNTTL